MLVLTADCLPIAVARVPTQGSRPAVGILHAGWRGLLAGVVSAGVRALGTRSQLTAAIGPSIGPCCYDVGDEVPRPFPQALRTPPLPPRNLAPPPSPHPPRP